MLLKEYDRIKKVLNEKYYLASIIFVTIALVLIISFFISVDSKLGILAKIFLPLLFLFLIWEIFLLMKYYMDKKLFVIISSLLNKDEDGEGISGENSNKD
ncbi:MAG: hypothetical protein QHH13_09955 [Melioribacter sp.]|uniref:hypothetical protein n=1 Tax=Rosettibacter primus TaxID=3111523 RepID=UPI00247B440D|nr:hypothetical protein [Melioribacter sp.]